MVLGLTQERRVIGEAQDIEPAFHRGFHIGAQSAAGVSAPFVMGMQVESHRTLQVKPCISVTHPPRWITLT